MKILNTFNHFNRWVKSKKDIDVEELKNILADLKDIGYKITFRTKKRFYDPIWLDFYNHQGTTTQPIPPQPYVPFAQIFGPLPTERIGYDVPDVEQNMNDKGLESGDLVSMFEEAVDRIEDEFGLILFDAGDGTDRFCRCQSGNIGFRGGNPGRSDDTWELKSDTRYGSWIQMSYQPHLAMTFKLKDIS